jgi:hypothetical protein
MTEHEEKIDNTEDAVEHGSAETDIDEELERNSEIIWTLSPELTSTLAHLTSSIDAITNAISGLAQHPYDLAKSLHFETDYVFPTIQSVEVPEAVTYETLVLGFEKSHNEYQDRIIDYITTPSKYDVKESSDQLNLLSELSGENKFIITPEKYCSYITTLEMLQQIDIDDIHEENSHELILKIGYTILNAFRKRTID